MTLDSEKVESIAQTAEVVEYTYEPKAPVRSRATLRDLVNNLAPQVLEIMPRHLTPERLFKTLHLAFTKTPKLFECSQASIIQTIMDAGQLGLDLSGPLGEAYPVPFKGECVLIPGYRGLAKLARQSGEIKRLESNVVREHDEFDLVEGSEFRLTFKRNLKHDRGKTVGCYSLAEFKDGGIQAVFMTVEEIEKRRQVSSQPNGEMWSKWWDEGAKKTTFRALAKWLPLSSDKFNAAMSAAETEYPTEKAIGVFDPAEVVPVEAGTITPEALTKAPESDDSRFAFVAESEKKRDLVLTALQGAKTKQDVESAWKAFAKLKDDIVSEHHVDLTNAKREALERIAK